MKKQVIIDKGRGMFERVIWDDSTNERIPEDTIGFLKSDTKVVPIVDKSWIKENSAILKDKNFPSVCKYCKPNLPKSGIPIEAQCRLLSAIQVQFTSPYCLLGSTLFNLSCTVQLPGLRFICKFYDHTNKEYDSLLIDTSQLNFSGYLHTGIPHTITVQVQDSEPGAGNKYRVGECIRKFTYLNTTGSTIKCLLDARKDYFSILYDPIHHKILYRSHNGVTNLPNQIYLVTTDTTYGPHYFTPINLDQVTDFTMQPALGWYTTKSLYSRPSYLLRNVNFGQVKGDGTKLYNTVAVLGLFNDAHGDSYHNFYEVDLTTKID